MRSTFSHSLGNGEDVCFRSQIPRRTHGYGGSPTYVGPKPQSSSACALHCAGWGNNTTWQVASRQRERQIPFSCQSDEQGLPGEVCPGLTPTLQGTKALLSRPNSSFSIPRKFRRIDAQPFCQTLGDLR